MSLSHLWRSLEATEPLFTVSAHETWDDTELASLSLTRGGDGAGVGWRTNHATVAVAGDVPNSHDQSIAVAMTAAGAALIAARCGNRTAAQLAARWYGRIGQQTATDYDDTLERLTNLTAADWMTELTRADLGVTKTLVESQGRTMATWMADLITRHSLPAGVPQVPTWEPNTPGLSEDWDATEPAGGPFTVTPSDLSDWLAAFGILFHVRRDGAPLGANMDQLIARADAWTADDSPPLTRRQCVSPATWEQPASSPAVVTWEDETPHTYTLKVGSGARAVRVTGPDFTDLQYLDPAADPNTHRRVTANMTALANRLGGWAYTVPEVTVDMLELLTSEVAEDRAQAGQLLTAELLDPIALSYDWPDPVIGLYYLTAATETITPDSWTMTLALAPTTHVTGEASPAVPGRTWDTAYPRTTEWDDPPPTTTWDTAPE